MPFSNPFARNQDKEDEAKKKTEADLQRRKEEEARRIKEWQKQDHALKQKRAEYLGKLFIHGCLLVTHILFLISANIDRRRW